MITKKLIMLTFFIGFYSTIQSQDANTYCNESINKAELVRLLNKKYKKMSKIRKKISKKQEMLKTFMDTYIQLRRQIIELKMQFAKKTNSSISEKEIEKNTTIEWDKFHDLFFNKLAINKNTAGMLSKEFLCGDNLSMSLLKFYGISDFYEEEYLKNLVEQWEILLNETIKLQQQIEKLN